MALANLRGFLSRKVTYVFNAFVAQPCISIHVCMYYAFVYLDNTVFFFMYSLLLSFTRTTYLGSTISFFPPLVFCRELLRTNTAYSRRHCYDELACSEPTSIVVSPVTVRQVFDVIFAVSFFSLFLFLFFFIQTPNFQIN